jgi:O-methyltransferase involved in polyketide biosynthesis
VRTALVRFAAARVAGIVLGVVELAVVVYLFAGPTLAPALAAANGCRLVASFGSRGRGGVALAGVVVAALVLAVGPATPALAGYAALCAVRVPWARRRPPDGLSAHNGALLALILCWRWPNAAIVAHLLDPVLAASITWPRVLDTAMADDARRAAPAIGVLLWLIALGVLGWCGATPGWGPTLGLLPFLVVLSVAAAAELAAGGRDVSITAFYTNATWTWGKLAGAELLASGPARAVFAVTNFVLALTRPFHRAPSVAHGLLQRHIMIDRLLADAAPAHVLELAAGLSRRGVATSADPAVTYTEVDRAPVVAYKRRLLARSLEGQAVLARPNLRLVAADLAEAPLDGIATGAPLFVIAEGLFMYLDADAQRALWRRVRALFADRPGTFVFDLVPGAEQPSPGRAGRVLEWVFTRFTGGGTVVRDPRDRDAIATELQGMGFVVERFEPRDVAGPWKLPHSDVQTLQLLFVCRV